MRLPDVLDERENLQLLVVDLYTNHVSPRIPSHEYATEAGRVR